MAKNYFDISLAFAGVCQSALLVQQFAQKGEAQRAIFRPMIESVLVKSPENTLDVYGNELNNLKEGFKTALAQLGGGNGKLDTEIGRYWINLLALSQKLDKNPQAKAELSKRLQKIEQQLPLYDNDLMTDQIIANLAAIYSDVISPLGSKIHVLGSQDYLVRPDIQNKIRASLLAGIRSGILWQQVGGNRWQFLFSRRKLFNQTKQIYHQL